MGTNMLTLRSITIYFIIYVDKSGQQIYQTSWTPLDLSLTITPVPLKLTQNEFAALEELTLSPADCGLLVILQLPCFLEPQDPQLAAD